MSRREESRPGGGAEAAAALTPDAAGTQLHIFAALPLDSSHVGASCVHACSVLPLDALLLVIVQCQIDPML